MKGGWLEHEIRSLPQVLACSITKDDVVVLVQPSADPVTVERAVEELLRRSGVDRPVRVFGGARPVFVEPVRVRNGRSAFVGTLSGAVILAAGVWLAGASTGLRGGGSKTRATVAALAPQVARELVDLPVIGGGGPSVPEPRDPPPPLLRPASSPIFGGGTGSGPSVSKPPAPSPPRPRSPRPQAPAATECNAPHSGVPVREKVGRGNGPPSWSHSIFVPAHCTTGRPR